MIRWLVYLLAKSSAINCEIEAWYMWELLPQQLLTTGDAAYYLSTLFSSVHVLKNPESIKRLKNISNDGSFTESTTVNFFYIKLKKKRQIKICCFFFNIDVT